MLPWETLDRASIPGGGELTLVRRGKELAIRVNGAELMASRSHASEERMATLVREHIAQVKKPRVLIGGLGLGYTLRATLDACPKSAMVIVAELVPAVVEWMRGPLSHLAGRPLDDPRTVIEELDAGVVLRNSPGSFDAVLIDIDNSPTTLARASNSSLYSAKGLAFTRDALAPGGMLVVWSAGPDLRFAERMKQAGFVVTALRASAHEKGRGRAHTLYVGATTAPGKRPAPKGAPARGRAS